MVGATTHETSPRQRSPILAVAGLLVGAAAAGTIVGLLKRAGVGPVYTNALMALLIGLMLYPVLHSMARSRGSEWNVRFWPWAAWWLLVACFSALVIHPLVERLL